MARLRWEDTRQRGLRLGDLTRSLVHSVRGNLPESSTTEPPQQPPQQPVHQPPQSSEALEGPVAHRPSSRPATTHRLECVVCLEVYEEPPSELAPVSLPCGHSMCRRCTSAAVKTAEQGLRQGRAADGAINCPTCRKSLATPEGGAWPCNYALVELMRAVDAQDPPPRAEGEDGWEEVDGRNDNDVLAGGAQRKHSALRRVASTAGTALAYAAGIAAAVAVGAVAIASTNGSRSESREESGVSALEPRQVLVVGGEGSQRAACAESFNGEE